MNALELWHPNPEWAMIRDNVWLSTWLCRFLGIISVTPPSYSTAFLIKERRMNLFQGTHTQEGHALAMFLVALITCSEHNKPQQDWVNKMQSSFLMVTSLSVSSIFTQKTVLVIHSVENRYERSPHSGENSPWLGLGFPHIHSRR